MNVESPLLGLSQRVWPQNIQAEQALLGALLAVNRTYDRVADFLEPEHFAAPEHQRIYGIIRDRVTQGLLADAVTLKGVLDGAGILDEVGGTAYLAQLLSAMVSPLTAGEYGHAIHDAWLRRQLIQTGSDIVELAFGGDPSLDGRAQIGAAERALAELGTGGKKGAVLSTLGSAVNAALARAASANASGVSPALMTGFMAVDSALGGFWPGEMTLLAGIPGSGKSALAMGIGISVAETRYKAAINSGVTAEMAGRLPGVLFLSREMSADQLASRIAGQKAGVSARKLMRGDFDMLMAERLVQVEKEMQHWPLHIYDCRRTPLRILAAKTRMLLQRQPAVLVILDHLLVADTEQPSDKRRAGGHDASSVSAAAYAQREIAGDFNIPFLVLSQMSRPARDNRGRRPTMQDLKYGGEDAADSVAFVHRPIMFMDDKSPEPMKKETSEDHAVRIAAYHAERDAKAELAELVVAKQRMEGTSVVRLRFRGTLTQFSDWRDDEPPASQTVALGELWGE